MEESFANMRKRMGHYKSTETLSAIIFIPERGFFVSGNCSMLYQEANPLHLYAVRNGPMTVSLIR